MCEKVQNKMSLSVLLMIQWYDVRSILYEKTALLFNIYRFKEIDSVKDKPRPERSNWVTYCQWHQSFGAWIDCWKFRPKNDILW